MNKDGLIIILIIVISLYCVNYCNSQADTIRKVNANTDKGFYWPYFLFLPSDDTEAQFDGFIIIPNNTGYLSDDNSVHQKEAYNLLI